MSQSDQPNQLATPTGGAVAYPPTSHAMAPQQPPVGYPTTNKHDYAFHSKLETQSRGDGFWKGCCAALCCCCVLDACF